jgi:prepilin-type N-terminal cleavage/methylation domain-containing protein
MDKRQKAINRKAGFTLIETLVAVLVLTILMVGVFSAINKAQGHYRVENQRVDLTQEQRAFLDQFTRDLHQAGFPPPVIQGLPAAPGGFNGITAFPTATDLTMQGDVDGTGVQTIRYVYNPPNAPACNCLQRIVNGVPSTAVENVVAPNPQEIFTAYDVTGTPVPPGGALASIRSVRITFTVQGQGLEDAKARVQTTMTGMARLPNNN